jgi:hypothetical protein
MNKIFGCSAMVSRPRSNPQELEWDGQFLVLLK